MRLLLLLFALASGLLSQTVTNATFDGVSHSAVRMTISYMGEFNAIRARYVPAPTSCKNGRTGPIQAIAFYNKFNPMPVIVSGLQAGTVYEICPELSSDWGNTWSSGFGAVVTTQPLPSQHPELPIPPEKFKSDYPDTSAFTKVATTSNCSDLHDLLMEAVNRSLTSGTVINLPTGGSCVVSPFDFNVNPPDLLWFGADAVTTSASTLTLPGHGLTEGQKIQIVNYSPYWGGSLPQTEPFALADGQTYYAHILNANTIQIYYEASASNGGKLLNFVSQGSGFYQNYVVPLPRRVNPIIIQSAGANTALIEHVRVTPSDANQMTKLIMPRSQIGPSPYHFMFRFSDLDANVRRAIGNIRFVGIEFTTEDFADLHNTIDPPDYENIFIMSPWNAQISIDRCWVHSPGAPTRWNRGMFWDGAYLAVIDSYFDNLTYFRATNENIVASLIDDRHAQITAGTSYSGGSTHTLSAPVRITISGGGSGEILTGWDLKSNRFTIWTPPGLTATCDGVDCVNTTYTSNFNISCNWSDAWPRNASGWVSAHPTGCFGAANGVLDGVWQGDPTSTQWTTEGCNFMVGGLGPGPYKVVNTMIEGAGLPWHHDDGGLNSRLRGDYDYERNTFHADFRFRYGSKNSDHLRYFHRQSLEWKSGRRLYLKGNTFDGGWVEANPASVMVALTAINGQTISDVFFESNEFRHGPGGLNIFVPTKGNTPVVIPPQRFRFLNNLIWDLNSGADTTCQGQPSYYVAGSGWPCSIGWFFQGPWSSEDIIIDHNTFLGNTGRVPSVLRTGDGPVEGVSITNNIIAFADQGLTLEPMAIGEPCSGLFGKDLADCKLPGFTFAGNVLLGQSGGFSTSNNVSAPGLNSLNYVNPDYSGTPEASGAGVNLAALRAAQGGSNGSSDLDCSACFPADPQGTPPADSVPTPPPTGGSSDPGCPTCSSQDKTVSVMFKGSVEGASIVVSGDDCSAGTHALPITLQLLTAHLCSVQVKPPTGYTLSGWNDLFVSNPQVFAIPSTNSEVTLSFSPDCPACSSAEKTVSATFKGSINGASIVISGDGCSPNTYALPITLQLLTAHLCSVQVKPPSGYVFSTWNDLFASNPQIFTVPSTDSIFTLSFSPLETPPAVSAPSPLESGFRYVPMVPCRVMDTRELWKEGGGPAFEIGETRLLSMIATRCNVPAAAAYALNVTVIPLEPLRWLTIWPAGTAMPFTSLLNSLDGRVKSSAAIVAAGQNSGFEIFATNATHIVVDVSGYFVTGSQSTFHSMQPCRVVDTRMDSGLLGSPAIPALTERNFPILNSPCALPETADAYSMILTVIPRGNSLMWMTAWPSGLDRPLASAVNDPTPLPVANSAIIQRGAGGNISVYGSDEFDLLVDVNGYFSSDSGGYSFYPASPCRMLDTRESGTRDPLNGTTRIDMAAACAAPTQTKAIAGVVTVVPRGPLEWLTLWGEGDRPLASTLNAYDAAVTSNFSITPLTSTSSINVFVTNPTHVVFDTMGYFAP